MPISAHDLFSSIGLTIKGSVRWRQRLPCNSAGVYAVSLSDDPDRNDGCLARAPISADLVRAWIAAVPTFTFDGVSPPEARDVVSFLERMWLPDESIVCADASGSLVGIDSVIVNRTLAGTGLKHFLTSTTSISSSVKVIPLPRRN
jgi:hypothetical protein